MQHGSRQLLLHTLICSCFFFPPPILPSPSPSLLLPSPPPPLPSPPSSLRLVGQMVLFTAPEDMVLGQACQLHCRDITARETVRELNSSHKLVKSVMDYEGQKGKEIKVNISTRGKQDQRCQEKLVWTVKG